MRRVVPLSLLALVACLLTPPQASADQSGSEPAKEPAEAVSPEPAEAVSPEPVEAAQPKPAAPTIPKTRLYLTNLDIIRIGPLGLETQNRLVLQRRLMDSESLLFRDTFVNGALNLKLNPAYFKVGPMIDIQPIALLNLRAGYEFMRFFGTFGYLQSFPEPTEALVWDVDTRGANAEAGLSYITQGHHLFLEPTVQVKVGKIAVRSKFAFEYWNMALQNGDTVFYDATLNTLVPAQGTVWTNDTDLLYVSGGKLTAGIRYSAVFPKYDETEFQDGVVADELDGNHHRIGALIAWSFNTRDYTSFNRPTLLLNVAYYFKQPNETDSGLYALLGFGFNSDFLKKK